MGADEDVDLALLGFFEDELLFLRGAEAGDHLDVDGEVGEAALEGLVVLEAEDGGRGEDCDLLSVLHGFEGGAHGDFGFAVADIAAEEAVHGLGGFHVGLDVGDCGDLVVGFVEVEGIFELALHVGVGGEGCTLCCLTLGVELEKLGRHVGHGFFYTGFCFLPALRAEAIEFRWGAGFAGAVFLDEIEAGEGDVEFGFVGELEDHEFERYSGVFFDDAEAAVAGDAVFDMNDVVADGEVAEVGDEGSGFGFAAADGAGGDVGFVGEILRAEEDELAGGGFVEVENLNAGGDGDFDDDRACAGRRRGSWIRSRCWRCRGLRCVSRGGRGLCIPAGVRRGVRLRRDWGR